MHMADTLIKSDFHYILAVYYMRSHDLVLLFEPQRGRCTRTIMNLMQDSAYCTAATNTSRDFHHLKHATCDDFPLLTNTKRGLARVSPPQ